jgi:fatty-acyl-CoA synthase
MAIRYAPEERAALDARARAMLAECADVGSFIRRGLGRNPGGEALVYLRTALDPGPIVTSAAAFQSLLGSASRWLRRNGIGPSDVVSLLAPNCTATSVAYWAAMSSATVQPLNLLFSREAIISQVNAVQAKILFTAPPGAPGGLYEKVEGLRAQAPSLQRIVVLPLDGTVAFDGEEIVPHDGVDEPLDADGSPDRVVALLPTGGTTGAPKVVPLTNHNVVASATASMLAGALRSDDRILVALPLFHVGGSFCASLAALGAGATLVIPTAAAFAIPRSSGTSGVSSRRSA